MKAKIEFNLPEENEEFKIASAAQSMHNVLFYIRNNMFRKYEDLELSEGKRRQLETIICDINDKIFEYEIEKLF